VAATNSNGSMLQANYLQCSMQEGMAVGWIDVMGLKSFFRVSEVRLGELLAGAIRTASLALAILIGLSCPS
jgi:hypothetical protein